MELTAVAAKFRPTDVAGSVVGGCQLLALAMMVLGSASALGLGFWKDTNSPCHERNSRP